MGGNKRLYKVGRTFVALLIAGGLVLTFFNRDAISMGQKEKEGILTAEQINISFQDIGGKLVLENVKEAQQVKQGDVLMALDNTDWKRKSNKAAAVSISVWKKQRLSKNRLTAVLSSAKNPMTLPARLLLIKSYITSA